MKRVKNTSSNQRSYWNELAEEYHRSTRIRKLDFHYGPCLAGEKKLKILPDLKKGMRALELGCGAAQNSFWLASRGLDCTALDVSEEQLAHASGTGVALFRSEIETFPRVTGNKKFHLIHSAHAFEFLENPGRVIADCGDALVKGGWLMVSTVHPVYNGDWVTDDSGVGGRFLTNYFNPVDDVRDDYGAVRICSRAWPVETWFRWFRDAGFELCDLREPPADENPAYTSDAWADDDGESKVIPTTIVFLARKK